MSADFAQPEHQPQPQQEYSTPDTEFGGGFGIKDSSSFVDENWRTRRRLQPLRPEAPEPSEELPQGLVEPRDKENSQPPEQSQSKEKSKTNPFSVSHEELVTHVGSAHDPEEQKADRIAADKKPGPAPKNSTPTPDPAVPDLGLPQQGSALPQDLKKKYAPKLGRTLDEVNIISAPAHVKYLGAKAFTWGKNIYTGTETTDKHIRHEIGHFHPKDKATRKIRRWAKSDNWAARQAAIAAERRRKEAIRRRIEAERRRKLAEAIARKRREAAKRAALAAARRKKAKLAAKSKPRLRTNHNPLKGKLHTQRKPNQKPQQPKPQKPNWFRGALNFGKSLFKGSKTAVAEVAKHIPTPLVGKTHPTLLATALLQGAKTLGTSTAQNSPDKTKSSWFNPAVNFGGSLIHNTQDFAKGAIRNTQNWGKSAADLADKAWKGTKDWGHKAQQFTEAIPGWIDKHVDQYTQGRAAIVNSVVKRLDHIPVVGKVAQAYAWYDNKVGEFSGGILKGGGSLVGGIANMVTHPVETATGLYGMAEHVPIMGGLVPNPLKLAHAGTDIIFNGADPKTRLESVLDPRKSLQDDAKFGKAMVDGFIEPYKKSWSEGKYFEIAGRATFDIGSMFIGAGEVNAAIKTGKAASVASRTAKVTNVANKTAEVSNIAAKTGEVANVANKTADVANVASKTAEVTNAASKTGKTAEIAATTAKATEGTNVAAKAGKASEVTSTAGKGNKAAEVAGATDKVSDVGKGAKSTKRSVAETGGKNNYSIKDYIDRWEKYAPEAYDKIRASKTDVDAIAKNTKWPKERIQRIKEHLFEKEHRLDERVGRFDADPDIADAWHRLQKGQHVPEDIRLLEHEYFESRFEGIFKTNYRTAHDATNRSGRTWEAPEYTGKTELGGASKQTGVRNKDVEPIKQLGTNAKQQSGRGVGKRREHREKILDDLTGLTEQGNRIAEGIRSRDIRLNVLGDEMFDRAYASKGGRGDSPQAFALKRQVYIKRSSHNFLSDIVHEGTHALDHLNPPVRLPYSHDPWPWEKRAFFYERQFQRAGGGTVEFETIKEMNDFIYEYYQ